MAKPSSRKKSKPVPKRKASAKSGAKASVGIGSKGQWVYLFGGGKAQGRSGMKELLGGKGANLAEMANLGLPVPPGFTITTEVCTYYYDHGRTYPPELKEEVARALAYIGRLTGRSFGDTKNPLLVS